MTDLNDDGALAPADDNALFSSAVDGTLADLPDDQPLARQQPEVIPPVVEPAIPPSRLREEADARRAAERERDELRGRLSAFEQQNRPKVEAPPRPDVFENPSRFVQDEVNPLIDPVKSQIGSLTEFYSRKDAVREHGQEKVTEAFQALDQAAKSGDPDAVAAVARVKKSMDPFGDIVTWHSGKKILAEVGSDPKAYRNKVIEEALKDPEVQKRFLESMRSAAQQSGRTVNRAVSSQQSQQSLPSLTRVGAAALPDDQDVDDATLFASATRGKRSA